MRRAAGLVALCLVAGTVEARVVALDAVQIAVSDLDRAVEFYTGVLEFRKLSEREVAGADWEEALGVFGVRARIARLQLGSEPLELIQYLAPEGRPYPADARSNDATFQHVAIIVSDMARAYAKLRAARVRHASTGPQRLPDWNPGAGGIEAFYFKDPDGHPLEILAFPPGKGEPRWQAKDRLFLGLDHTAIVVAETGPSLALYRDGLGLRRTGESENHGTEQEHLNNVAGARLKITGLRATTGPGIELLDYVVPEATRAAGADQAPNDLVSTVTVLVSDDLDADARALGARVVGMSDASAGFTRAALARDADGHFLRLIEKGSDPFSEGARR